MRSMSRHTSSHLSQIQNRDNNGKRHKKKRRSNKRMWLEADSAFHRARDSLNITRDIRALITHPELKEKATEDQLQTISGKAKEIALAARDQIAKLEKLRNYHIAVRAKYPKTQRHHHNMNELIDNMTVLDGYAQWTEETMKIVILPCAELTEHVEEIQPNLQSEPQPLSESDNHE